MSTGTIPTPPPLPDTEERLFIDEQLDRTRAQVKTVDVLFGLLAAVVGALVLLLAAVVVDHWVLELGVWGRTAALASLFLWMGYCAWRWIAPSLLRGVNPLYAAHAIESHQPSLKNSLINYLLIRAHDEEAVVVRKVLERQAAHDIAEAPIDAAIDRTHVLRLSYALVAVVLACALYTIASPKNPFQTTARVIAPLAEIARPARVRIREVSPGDAAVFHGSQVTVSAVIEGLRTGEDATLLYTTADGQRVDAAIPLTRSETGRSWQGEAPDDSLGAQQNFRYRIRAGDAVSEEFHVQVVPAPSVVVNRVDYVYPAYTRRQPFSVTDRGDLSALEGTRVTVHAAANQPVQSAWIEFDPAPEGSVSGDTEDSAASLLKRLPMQVDGTAARASFRLEWDPTAQAPRHGSYRVRFITAEGQRNRRAVVYAIDVQRDAPPEANVLEPKQTRVEVPEDGVRKIVIRAVDADYGLSRITLRAVAGGSELTIPALLDDPAGRTEPVVVAYEFRPRDHGLKSGDEIMYWARVEDNRVAPGQTTPAPNASRTPDYHLVVTPPAKAPPESTGDTAADEENSEGGSGEGSKKSSGGEEGEGSEGGGGGSEQGEEGQEGEGEEGGGQGGMGGGQAQSGDSGQSQSSGESPMNGAGSASDGASESEPSGEGGGQGAPMPGDSSGDSSENSTGTGGGAGQEKSNTGEAGQNSPPSQGGGGGQAKPNTPQGAAPQNPAPSSGQPSSGNGAPNQPLSADGSQDREVFERIQDFLQDQTAQSPAQSPQNAAGQTPPSGGNSSGQPSQNNPPQSANPQGAAGQSPMPQPGQSPQNAGQRDQTGSQQKPDQKQGESEGQQAGGGEGGSPQGPAETRKEQANPQNQPGQTPPTPGMGDNGQSGAGAKTDQSRGSPQSQEANRDRQKNSEAGNAKESGSEASSPSTSKRQSNSQGGQGGDRSGGGEQGGGQGAKQEGNDSAGSSSAGDEGAGAASEPGAGETSNQAGNQKLANDATGQTSDTPGQGSGTQQSPEGGGPQQPNTSPQSSPPGSAPPTPPNAGASPSQNSAQQGNRDGTGQPTLGAQPQGGSPSQNPPPAGEPPPVVPESEDVNLDYARKATDLALEKLREQKQNADAELLKRLGWTSDELQQFLARWDAMKRAAAQNGPAGDEARQTLNETLESLGLRPTNSRLRKGQTKSDQVQGLRESGHRSTPPPEYQKLFEAYLKGAGR